jgi:hypothetical protein
MANRMKGVSKQTVEDWLIILEKEGYIKRIGTSQRRILLTRQGQKLPDTHQVPPTFNESVSLLSSASISVETSLDQPTSIPVASGNIYVEVSNINLVPMKGGERDGTT